MAPPPNCFLYAITYVIAREKQRKQLGSGTIADGETDAKNVSVDGPLKCSSLRTFKIYAQIYRIPSQPNGEETTLIEKGASSSPPPTTTADETKKI
jgi:hypothetical protein